MADLNQRLRDVATCAKAGKLRGSELGDPTLTVTNLGEQGVEAIYGVIFPPQVALVGFGSIVERPWAVDGLLGVRPVVTATLSADHRASDGHRGALFLTAIAEHLNRPEDLWTRDKYVRWCKPSSTALPREPTSVASGRTRTCAARSICTRSIS
jgi:pyruvate dehydrogenase E2 component (dihydrolipoamide acetyltransferase)